VSEKGHVSNSKITLIGCLIVLGLTACGDNSQVKSLPADIDSICQDKLGDANVSNDDQDFGLVREFADIKSVRIETGEFDIDSSDTFLTLSIEMFTWNNPVYLNAIAQSSTVVSRSVSVSLGDLTTREVTNNIRFEWTETKLDPSVKVTRVPFSSPATTVYEPELEFRDNQYFVRIPLTVFENLAKGSQWFAFSIASYFTQNPITISMATDECQGVL